MEVTLLVAGAVLAALFMAWTVGANSNSAPISPAVGANALSVRTAAALVGVVASAGALAQGAAVSHTVGTGFVDGATLTPLATVAALLTTATFITIGNRYGYPIPAAFTVTGATIGAGLALGGSVATSTLLGVLAFWLTIPVVEAVIAFTVAYVLLRTWIPDTVVVPALAAGVGAVLANATFTFLPDRSLGQSVAGNVAPAVPVTDVVAAVTVTLGAAALLAGLTHRVVAVHGEDGVRWFLVALGLLVVFTSGGSQVGLAVGPLLPAIEGSLGVSPFAVLVVGALGIVVGAWTGAPRLIRAVSHEYSDLGPYRAISALVPAFLVAQAAIFLGYPISFNKVIIAAVVGSGLVDGLSGISEGKTAVTVAAWGGSMTAAGVTAFALYHASVAVIGGA